jgi:hypothetical protein
MVDPMLQQAETPQSLHAFGIGMAVGFGAGFAMRVFWPGATSFAEAVLSKLGFEVGDIFLALWNPEEAINPTLQIKAKRAPVKRKVARKATAASPVASPASEARASRSPTRKATVPSTAPLAATPRARKPARPVKPTAPFSDKRRRTASAMGIGAN